MTKTSGYCTASTTFDGKGLLTPTDYSSKLFLVCLNFIFLLDARRETEYRTTFNSVTPYHMETTTFHTRKLKERNSLI